MMKMFAAFDVKAAVFGSPMVIATRGLALRAFSDVCADPRSQIAKYPADYSLYEVGEWDPTSGELKSIIPPQLVCTAASMIQQLKNGEAVPAEESGK